MDKYIKTRAVLLSGLILTSSALAQYARMTNQTIRAMVHGGMSVAIITEAIKTAPQISLNANKQESDELVQAGASDSDANLIMKAIELRGNNGPLEPGTNQRPRLARGENLIVSESTPVRLRLTRNLSSEHTRTSDTIHFEVLEDVYVNNRVGKFLVIQRGGSAWGTITDAGPKRRMGRSGKMEVTLDFVSLTNGDKIALTATEAGDRHGHVGLMVGLMVPTAVVYLPAAPFWLLMHGKESTIKDGLNITAATVGVANLDSLEFEQR